MAAARPEGAAPQSAPLRVSTLELFFDLVFAFTLTQLTALLTARLSVAGAAQALLVSGCCGGCTAATANLLQPPLIGGLRQVACPELLRDVDEPLTLQGAAPGRAGSTHSERYVCPEAAGQDVGRD